MAYRNEREEQWNRGDWQRGNGERQRNEPRDWERSTSERARTARPFGGSEERRRQDLYAHDHEERAPQVAAYDRGSTGYDRGGAGDRSRMGSYDPGRMDSYDPGRTGSSDRGYGHSGGESYGGEDKWSPRYGERARFAPGGYGHQFGEAERGDWARRNSDWDEPPRSAETRGYLNRGFGLSDGPSMSGSGYSGGYSGTDYRRNYGANSSDGSGWGYATYGSRSGSEIDSQAARTGYSGRGPKGYRRSDERIKEDVCERLSMDDDVDASDITVSVRNGEVSLDGSVETRRMKHRAEDIAESVSGVSDVHNNVRVVKGFLNEMVDRVTGTDREQHFANSGTRNAPTGTSANPSSLGTTSNVSNTSSTPNTTGQSTPHPAR